MEIIRPIHTISQFLKNHIAAPILVMVAACFFAPRLAAQPIGNFACEKIETGFDVDKLRSQFNSFSIYHMDSKAIKALASSEAITFMNLDFGGERFASFTLQAHDMRSDDYKLLVSGPSGLIEQPRPENVTYRGITDDGGRVVLTIDDHFITGFITMGGERFYIEAANRFDPAIGADKFVMYRPQDVVPSAPTSCTPVIVEDELQHIRKAPVDETTARNPPTGCVTVRLGIASDASMYTKYGTVLAVTTQTAAIMALVGTDYDSDFSREIIFSIVANIVSTSAASCPESGWSTSTNAGTLLAAFRAWGNSSGCGQFGVAFDLAQLWTNRDLDGSTVGLAYYPGVCSSFKYHILQDYTSDPNSLRCMTSHEIGHNFYADHDASSAYIMFGSVTGSTTWSPTSMGAINGWESSSSCGTGSYALAGSALARFSLPSQWCINNSISLIDQSYRSPTSWSWSMSGGTPSSASTQNSSVSYASAGTKSVDLTVANANCGGTGTSATRTVNIISSTYPVQCSTSGSNTGITNYYQTGPTNVTLTNMNVTTGYANEDGTAFVDSTCSSVATVSANANSISVTIGTLNSQYIQAWIDYQNDGTFSNSTDRIINQSTATTGTQTYNFNIPFLSPPVVTGTLLKMRVMADVNLPVPCTMPFLGQSENYGVIILASALPIELAHFSGEKTPNGALLHWQTRSETNNAHFIIERSLDGFRFEAIGKVAGAGTSLQTLDYHLLDPTPWPGINYYRLAQVDYDGNINYSGIVEVVFSETTGSLEAVVAPNPIQKGRINFRVFSENEGEFIAEAIDLTGRTVASQRFEASSGWGDFQWPSEQFPEGQFLLVLKNAASVKVVKIQN